MQRGGTLTGHVVHVGVHHDVHAVLEVLVRSDLGGRKGFRRSHGAPGGCAVARRIRGGVVFGGGSRPVAGFLLLLSLLLLLLLFRGTLSALAASVAGSALRRGWCAPAVLVGLLGVWARAGCLVVREGFLLVLVEGDEVDVEGGCGEDGCQVCGADVGDGEGGGGGHFGGSSPGLGRLLGFMV